MINQSMRGIGSRTVREKYSISRIETIMRCETGSREANTDWLGGVGAVVEDGELIEMCVTIELASDDIAVSGDNPAVLV